MVKFDKACHDLSCMAVNSHAFAFSPTHCSFSVRVVPIDFISRICCPLIGLVLSC